MIGMWRRSGAHEVESVSRTARFVMHAIVNCIVMKFATIYETSPRDPLSNPLKICGILYAGRRAVVLLCPEQFWFCLFIVSISHFSQMKIK